MSDMVQIAAMIIGVSWPVAGVAVLSYATARDGAKTPSIAEFIASAIMGWIGWGVLFGFWLGRKAAGS